MRGQRTVREQSENGQSTGSARVKYSNPTQRKFNIIFFEVLHYPYYTLRMMYDFIKKNM